MSRGEHVAGPRRRRSVRLGENSTRQQGPAGPRVSRADRIGDGARCRAMRWLVVPGVLMIALGPLYALAVVLGDEGGSVVDGLVQAALVFGAGIGLAALARL